MRAYKRKVPVGVLGGTDGPLPPWGMCQWRTPGVLLSVVYLRYTTEIAALGENRGQSVPLTHTPTGYLSQIFRNENT